MNCVREVLVDCAIVCLCSGVRDVYLDKVDKGVLKLEFAEDSRR